MLKIWWQWVLIALVGKLSAGYGRIVRDGKEVFRTTYTVEFSPRQRILNGIAALIAVVVIMVVCGWLLWLSW